MTMMMISRTGQDPLMMLLVMPVWHHLGIDPGKRMMMIIPVLEKKRDKAE